MMRITRVFPVAALMLAGWVASPVFGGSPAAGPDPRIGRVLGLSAWTVQDVALPAAPGVGFTSTFQLGSRAVEVVFEPRSVRAPGFRVLVQDATGALRPIEAPPENTYGGSIAGVPGAVVAGATTVHGLVAMIRLGDESWYVDPLRKVDPAAPASAHVVYRGSEAIGGGEVCGLDDHGAVLPAWRPGASVGAPEAAQVCELACDADFEFYTILGSNTTTVTNDITAIVNAVSSIYVADVNISMTITQIIIRTSAATSPYTSVDPGTRLSQFRSQWLNNHANVPRDLAHLFTGADLTGSVIGIAYLNGICNTNAFGLSQSRWTTNSAYRVALTAHETGHNFSAQHCDTLCSPCQIMCSGLGGCSGNVSHFSACDKASITAYAATRPCLTPPVPPALTLPFADTFPTSTLDPLKWSANTGGIVTTIASNERTPPNSLDLILDTAVESAAINNDQFGPPVFVTFWTQHAGVENGKVLNVKYRNTTNGQFQPLTSVVSDGVDQTRFVYTEVKVPFDGFSATNARIRFEAAGSQLDDAWFVDDVGVAIHCRADINKDRALTVADFGAFQSAFVAGNLLVADMNDDGVLTVADFGAYQTRFGMGCY